MVSQLAEDLVTTFESSVGGEPHEWLRSRQKLLEYIEQLEKHSKESE